MKNFTPGPWKISPNGGGVIYVESHNGYVADICNRRDGIDNAARDAEREANARLIAAAPEMLAALQDVELRATQAKIASTIGRKSQAKQAEFLRGELERIAHAARAAILKATQP